jgi:hypothetical protein
MINPIVYGMSGHPVMIGGQPVHYDMRGGLIAIGNQPIHRDMTGRPILVGSEPVVYDANSRTSEIVGGLPIIEDRAGRPYAVVGTRIGPSAAPPRTATPEKPRTAAPRERVWKSGPLGPAPASKTRKPGVGSLVPPRRTS